MLPKDYIKSETNEGENNAIILEGVCDTTFTLIATNLDTATKLGAPDQTSINLSPKDTGIIVIRVIKSTGYGKNRSQEDYTLLLEVSNGKVILNRFWQPQKSGRTFAVARTGTYPYPFYVRVQTEDGIIYTSSCAAPGEYLVPDEKLLCQYAVGEIEEEALKAAATWQATEASAQERLPELETTIAKLEKEKEGLQHRINRKQKLIEGVSKHLLKLSKICSPWWHKTILKEVNEALNLIAE